MTRIILLMFSTCCLLMSACAPLLLTAQMREGQIVVEDSQIRPISQGSADATASADGALAGDIANQAVSVSYFGTQLLNVPGMAPTLSSANISMGFFAVMDLMKLVADAKERQNAIAAKIVYRQPLLFWHVVNGAERATPAHIPFSRSEAALMRNCSWIMEAKTFSPIVSKDERVQVGSSTAIKNIEVRTKELFEFLRYPEGLDNLPEDSSCNRKAAEQLLAKIVARRLSVSK